eukprot:Rmarinus@m.22108
MLLGGSEHGVFRVSMSRNFREHLSTRVSYLEKKAANERDAEIRRTAAWKRQEEMLRDYYETRIAAAVRQKEEELERHLSSSSEDREVRMQKRVTELVQDLYSRQFRAPIGEVQCVQPRNAVLDCYRQNPDDPLACRDAVHDFLRCAAEVRDKYVTMRAASDS